MLRFLKSDKKGRAQMQKSFRDGWNRPEDETRFNAVVAEPQNHAALGSFSGERGVHELGVRGARPQRALA